MILKKFNFFCLFKVMLAKNHQIFLIRLIHQAIILYILLGWIPNGLYYNLLFLSSLVCLKTHWVVNDDTCSLTILERTLTGVSKKESFIHQIVSPIYKIKDSQIQEISNKVVDILFIVIIFKIIFNPESKEAGNLLYRGEFRDLISKIKYF